MKSPLRSEKNKGCLLSPLLHNFVTKVEPGILGKEVKQKTSTLERRKKKKQLFVNDIPLYKENS